MRPQIHDWERLRAIYVAGRMSYSELARQEGISYRVVKDRGGREQWGRQRAEYRAQAYLEALEEARHKEVARLVPVMEAAGMLEDHVLDALADDDQFRRHLVPETDADGRTTTIERVYDKRDARAMRDLAASLKDLAAISRSVYGIPTQAEREAQRIAAERLELERRRTEDGRGDATIVVRMEGVTGEDVEDYAQ